MSVQEYPIFSKKSQMAKKKKYTFGTPGISENTLTWFRERANNKHSSRNSTPKSTKNMPGPTWISPDISSKPTPIHVHMASHPPGLALKKNTSDATTSTIDPFCTICGNHPIDSCTLTICKHTFCLECIYKHKNLWNRCPTCCKVIDQSKVETYEGSIPNIPSYDTFIYEDTVDTITDTITYDYKGLLEFSDITYSTPSIEIDPILPTNIMYNVGPIVDPNMYNIQTANYLDYSVLLAQCNNIIAQYVLQNLHI